MFGVSVEHNAHVLFNNFLNFNIYEQTYVILNKQIKKGQDTKISTHVTNEQGDN